jgi:hypothetical protein
MFIQMRGDKIACGESPLGQMENASHGECPSRPAGRVRAGPKSGGAAKKLGDDLAGLLPALAGDPL